MKILRIYIKNFKGIKELEAETNSNVVIINGDRGSGKTSFIEAIEWCLCVRPARVVRECIQKDKDCKVCLSIEKDNNIYDLEIHNIDGKRRFFIASDNVKKEYGYWEYVNFVKTKVIKNPYFQINFIDALYYGSKRKIGLTLSDRNLERINKIAKDYGFPVPRRRLAFDSNLDCQIYEGSRLLSGGYYSSGDNVLRMTVGKMIEVKFIEDLIECKNKKKNFLPLFLDDVFLMVSEEYVFYVCKYLQKFDNQLFITNNPSNELFFEKAVVVDLQKSKIS